MSPKSGLLIRIILSILFGVIGLAGFIPAMFTPMMFDAPGSDRNPATRMLAVSQVLFPFSCFLAIILSWLFLRLGNKSLWAFLIPVINLVVGVVALLWLLIAYGGNFGS